MPTTRGIDIGTDSTGEAIRAAAGSSRNTTLGIDIGTNSIGWALLATGDDGVPQGIIAAGVRIFRAGVNDKDQTPLNFERRRKRQLRRQIARRRQRRDRLRNLLIREDWLPAACTQPGAERLWNALGDPYALRAKALDHPLAPHELGRVLMHLSRHRGFQSNRRADLHDPDQVEERTRTEQGITELRRCMQEDGARTLGEWLARQPKRRNTGTRWLWTERAMLREEFALICERQAPHHPRLQDAAFLRELHDTIFWQRPLKSQAGRIGGCSLEPPKEIVLKAGTRRADGTQRQQDERVTIPWPRASMAWQECQRLRYWQDLNRLRLRDPATGAYRDLPMDERRALAEALERQPKLTWSQARKIIARVRGVRALHAGETFNLEDGGKAHLIGNATACAMRRHLEGTGLDWDALPPGDASRQAAGERSQAALIKDFLTIDDEEALGTRLERFWGLSTGDARQLAKRVQLEAKPGRLSLKAVKKLLPLLEAGQPYHEACQAAGYLRADQREREALPNLPPPPTVRNPVVARGLSELRRVVNALIAVHGLPGRIHVETARELHLSPRKRKQIEEEQRRLERQNEAARQFWREHGVEHPSRTDLLKYRCWVRQNHQSAYSDRPISQDQLRSGAVQLDHIWPYSRSFDDSAANYALCFADENVEKGDRTPFEWFGSDAARWQAFVQRVQRWEQLPFATRRRLLHREALESDDFLARQLNDTRYLSRLAMQWLGQLYPSHIPDRDGTQRFHYPVQVSKGSITAGLRHYWGLNSLLSGGDAKERRDHRHHLIDAVVIACTDRVLYQRLAQATAARRSILDVPPPWPELRSDLARLLPTVVVSHAVDHRLIGALHEDTAYGLIAQQGDQWRLRYRIPLAKAAKHPARIIDPVVRALITERLRASGWDGQTQPSDALIKQACAEPLLHRDGKTLIRTVRIEVIFSASSVIGLPLSHPTRYYRLGNNHHVELVRDARGRVSGRFITAFEAARRLRIERRPAVDTSAPPGGAFLCALFIDDTVAVPSASGDIYYRIQKMSEGKIEMRLVEAATLDDPATHLQKSPHEFIRAGIRLVSVDPIGRVCGHADAGSRGGQPGTAAPGGPRPGGGAP